MGGGKTVRNARIDPVAMMGNLRFKEMGSSTAAAVAVKGEIVSETVWKMNLWALGMLISTSRDGDKMHKATAAGECGTQKAGLNYSKLLHFFPHAGSVYSTTVQSSTRCSPTSVVYTEVPLTIKKLDLLSQAKPVNP